MGHSVLVFVSHSSDDKEGYIEPIVSDLEECYINVWIDKRKIVPGDNLRKSIFRDGLDKADVALIFFTGQSLKSSWVDREIKHVLREESKKGNDFDLNKLISIFDSQDTYNEISERYPELTDDLLHLMPKDYDKTHLGQLISAIWSKYLSLQGGDVETQKQILAKEKELFQKEKEITKLGEDLKKEREKRSKGSVSSDFDQLLESGMLEGVIACRNDLLTEYGVSISRVGHHPEAIAFGIIRKKDSERVTLTDKGVSFLKWYVLKNVDSESQS